MIKLIAWTDVGQREVLEELGSLKDVTVKVAISAADFLTSLPEAEVVVMTGTATAYSPEVTRRMCAAAHTSCRRRRDRGAIRAIARQLVANVGRFQRGEPPANSIHIHPFFE